MIDFPSYIVILWALPASVFALSIGLCSGYLLLQLLRFARKPQTIKQPSVHTPFAGDCRRRFLRMPIDCLRADISDGNCSYSGLVTNISDKGLCLINIPQELATYRSLLSIVVHGPDESYNLVARPRWQKIQDNNCITMSVELARSPDVWSRFVLSR